MNAMTSVFSAPALVPAAKLPPRPIDQIARTPPAQAQDAAVGKGADAPGKPVATGAEAKPTPEAPQPAPPPVSSETMVGRVTAARVQRQAEQLVPERAHERPDAPVADLEIEATRPDLFAEEPSETQARENERRVTEDRPPPDPKPEREAGLPDPSTQVAELYRDAVQTTAGLTPARLLMSA